MRALTFGELIDEVLNRLGFAGETGSLRDVAKSVVRASHEERVVNRDYSFMRLPAPSTFTLVGGQRNYSLSPYFRSPIWFRDQITGLPLVETQSSMQMDNGRPISTQTSTLGWRFELRGHSNVWAQPLVPGVLAAVSSVPGDDFGNTLTIEGLNAAGNFITETLTIGVALPSPQSFAVVTNIRKNGLAADWEGIVTVTADAAATILTILAPTEFGVYLRQIYILDLPIDGRVIEYDFWRQPARLEEDNDIPSIPAPFSRILVYDALLAMTGYSRATNAEQNYWAQKQVELQHSLDAAYDEGQSNQADNSYIHLVPRGGR